MTQFFCGACLSTHAFVAGACPLEGMCLYCKERPAELHFGDMLSFTHGGIENCCRLCAAEMQLAHAREQAALIPEREAEVELLRALDYMQKLEDNPDTRYPLLDRKEKA